MEQLTEISNRLINSVSSGFTRNLYHTINWSNQLIEIRGSRGVGKTTMMLQKAKELTKKKENVIYLSLDHAYFYQNKLVDFADTFYKYGGKYLFLDEVHKYPRKEKSLDWSQEIKNLYDAFPDLNIIYSGSSILQIYKGTGDLSRRKNGYHLPGLSLREYLEFNKIGKFEKITLNNIIDSHTDLTNEIIKSIKILPHFKNYLKWGYYPFYNESTEKYYDRLNDIVNVILESDIPAVSDITYETSVRLKKLLSLLSVMVPYAPNLSKMASQLYIADQRTLMKYLNLLEKAELIMTLGSKATGDHIFNKPDKIYLNNTNLMAGLSTGELNMGSMRETFLLNQLWPAYNVNYPKQGDFLVSSEYVFEVGGKNKKYNQIAGNQNAYLVMDDIETSFGNKIPLWLFGFLY